MPPQNRGINDAITDVRQLFGPLVYGVRNSVQSGVQYGAQYASILGVSIYNFYNFGRQGPPPGSNPGWRDGFAPEEIEEGLAVQQARTRSEPILNMHLSSSQTMVQIHTRETDHDVVKQADTVLRRQQKLASAYDKALGQRMQATQRRENLTSCLNFLEETVEAIARSIQNEDPSNSSSTQPDLAALLSQFREDNARLQSDISLLRSEDDTLLSLDGNLMKQSKKFADAATAFTDTAALNPGTAGPASPSSATQSSRRSPSPAPSLITKYLDKRGDVLMLKNKLQEFDVSYAEERNLREVRREQDGEPDTSDDNFTQTYEDEREEIAHDLALAEQAVTDLEFEGKLRGLDTSLAGRRSFESGDASPLGGETFELVPGNPKTNKDLGDWIQQVPTPHTSPGGQLVLESPNSMPQMPATLEGAPPPWTL